MLNKTPRTILAHPLADQTGKRASVLADRVLITGAAGFIGSHVAKALLSRGTTVIGLDNFDPFYDKARKLANIASIKNNITNSAGTFTLVEADMCDAQELDSLVRQHRITGIIHLAARAGVRPSIEQPVMYCHVNVTGTASVLAAAAANINTCSRVIIASSSSVYGNMPTVPFHEDMDVSEPISPYAATKRACELIGYTHWHLYKQPVGMLRFFTVYGPAQRPDLAISKFIEKISKGQTIEMFGNGATSRDYTFIDDIVQGVLASYDRIHQFGYRVWNLGGNQPVELTEMIRTIECVVGKKAQIKEVNMQMGDVERTFADLRRAKHELDYTPKTAFEDGVARQWQWATAHR